jgi:hypothetical protein
MQAMRALTDALGEVEEQTEQLRVQMQPALDAFNNMTAVLNDIRDALMEFDEFRM